MFFRNKYFDARSEIESYKNFALKEDMFKISIAFILGASFNNVAKGISELLIMPFINFIILQTGDSWRNFELEIIEGLTIEIGSFFGILVDFFLISIVLYVFYIKFLKFLVKEQVKIDCVKTKKCDYCKSNIHHLASKCPECTADLLNENSNFYKNI